MQTVKEILVAAKAKIANPENWTQGVLASDIDGQEVSPDSTHAVCFCSIGAIRSVSVGCDNDVDAMDILRKFTVTSITYFNDTSTHQEVLEVFDKAIAAAD